MRRFINWSAVVAVLAFATLGQPISQIDAAYLTSTYANDFNNPVAGPHTIQPTSMGRDTYDLPTAEAPKIIRITPSPSVVVGELVVATGTDSDDDTPEFSLSASAEVPVDLSVVKRVNHPAPNEGELVTYRITVTNTATSTDATGVLACATGQIGNA